MKYKYETSTTGNYHLLQAHAKHMRDNPTLAEEVMWRHLKGNALGQRFRRQHPINDYIADFVCLEAMLVIEIDGGYHRNSATQSSDAERTKTLAEEGFQVLRFTNEEIIDNPYIVTLKIKKIMEERMLSTQNTDTSSTQASSPLLGRGRGRCLIFSAPSGSGKSTIVQYLMQEHPEFNLAFSISATSRPPRGKEQHGVEYFFLTPEEFRKKIEDGEFLEYEEVYQDRFYGTLKSQVEHQLAEGQNVVFDVDVKGGCNIKQFYGDLAMSVFIQPPSIDELRRRLLHRATDDAEQIERRLAKAEEEMSYAPRFDKILVNDDLETAKAEAVALLRDFLSLN